MARNESGNRSTAAGKTPNPSDLQSLLAGRLPDPVRTTTKPSGVEVEVPAAAPWVAFGLRQTAAGYELLRIEMAGNAATAVRRVGQPEPQRAIAHAYLEAAVDESYFEGTR